MDKGLIDRRVEQQQAEGVEIRTGVLVGRCPRVQGHQLVQPKPFRPTQRAV